MKKKKILITGANFRNKGAQAMLFVTTDEIKKRFPFSDVFFASTDKMEFEEYTFTKVYASDDAKSIALDRNKTATRCKRAIKDCVKMLLGRKDNLFRSEELKRIMPSIDLIVDVSGFNLGKKWPVEVQESYLDHIRLAKKYHIPVILMPQSFGSFDYEEEKQYLIDEISGLLPYAMKIFAREEEGYHMLKDTFHLDNVEQSYDLVLQNKGIDLKNIFVDPKPVSVPVMRKEAVGIIPNIQCFNHGDKDRILAIYSQIIEKLLVKGKEVYVIRHSSDDLDVCRQIFDLFSSNHFHLMENDFSCFEYDVLIRQFDFIICSRYHGNVHAYRNCVPSILLGWAVKYKELAELFGQENYFFDITEDATVSQIVDATEKMCDQYREEGQAIKEKLALIQENNCFDILSKGTS